VLKELGLELEVVPCGGGQAVDQEREQWTDGANSFAIAPGVILLYRRNRRTLDELGRRGWRVLKVEEAAAEDCDLLGGGPTVIMLYDNELSRARGGPHCMTMPLERDSL
jgi:arginine deiminase